MMKTTQAKLVLCVSIQLCGILTLAGCGFAPSAPEPGAAATKPAGSVTLVPAVTATAIPPPTATPAPSTTPTAAPTVTPTATATPVPSPTPVVFGDRVYDVYIAAASKNGQRFRYSCEFDAAWVVLQTFGIDVTVDEIIERTPFDGSIEPSFIETADGFLISGGDIRAGFSGDYETNFLARASGSVFVPVFESYGLNARPVTDRAAVEAALRRGALVWLKTTVDFRPWRPAFWVTPDGTRIPTVLGNDHAVVAIGFNQDVVVIRDVLGPTSSNRDRPLEYEVDWTTFLNAWGAQGYDGLAVTP